MFLDKNNCGKLVRLLVLLKRNKMDSCFSEVPVVIYVCTYVFMYVYVCVCSCTRVRLVISVPQNRRNLSENRIHKRMLAPEKDLQTEKCKIRMTKMYQTHRPDYLCGCMK
jgi:hypothetical protein